MIKRNWKRIISSLILIVMFFPNTLCFGEEALKQPEIGEILAKYSYNFCKKYGYNSSNNMTFYDHDNSGTEDRQYGYRLELHSGIAQRNSGRGDGSTTKSYTNKYPMDCVGVVCTMIHQALGIGNDTFEFFIAPRAPRMQWFDRVSGTPQPGDILDGPGHVKIYIGSIGGSEGNVVEGLSANWEGATLTSSGYSGYTAYRIKETLGIMRSQCKDSPDGASLVGMGNMGTESEFYYNGIPDGEYSVAGSFWEWLVNALKDVFTYLVNIIFYIFRMVFVGFTAIIDNLITYIVSSITGKDINIFEDATSGWRNDGNDEVDKVNIETIIFDDVFDINFFETPATTTL